MAMEPINIFSSRVDPSGVVAVLRALDASLKVVGPDDDWEQATIRILQKGWKGPLRLTFLHDADYYTGPNWPRQRLGMQGYFSQFPDTPRKRDVLDLIGTFRFALATDWDPDLLPDADERLTYLFAVAQHLDGAIFTPSGLRDSQGRILISVDGIEDPQAVWPEIARPDDICEAVAGDKDEFEPHPPTAEQVARRALALAAVCSRALLESNDPRELRVVAFHERIQAWIQALHLGDELEPKEWEVVRCQVGQLDQQSSIDSTWRLEGLGVLAWALQRFELPPYDDLVEPQKLLTAVGLYELDVAKALVAHPSLRSPDELHACRARLFALHWRLRDFSLRPQAIDFEKFAREAWFGPLDIRGLKLVGGDLALAGMPIAQAPRDVVNSAQSSAMERHLAINWLHEGGVYSETDTST